MQVLVGWTSLLVPALAVWAIIGINAYRSDSLRPWMDTLYFLVMILIGTLTWRTMSANDSFWLVHTASLGTMIVAGVLPRHESADEAFPVVG